MKIYGFILFILFFISCQGYYTRNEVILEAEKLLDTAPDSSFQLLSSISNPQQLAKADYAAWCLHYTHACYKLQKKFTSDSVICIAVNYYKNSKLKTQSGTSYYLLGCISELLQKDKEAMAAYKEAENVLAQTNDNKLKGLVQFSLGYICMEEETYNKSLSYFKKSLHYFNQSKNIKYTAYAYREISKMYNQLDYPFDSVMHYSNLALKTSKAVGDSTNYYYILANQGKLLYNKDFIRSKECLLKGFEFSPSQRYCYGAYLAYIYSKLNKMDSANFYLNLSLTEPESSPYKIIGLHAAALIAQNSNDYKKAYNYLEKSYILRDSNFKQNLTSKLHSIDKQYDLTVKEEENAKLNIANQTKISWIAFLLVGLLTLIVFFLLARNRYKRKQTEHKMENQRLLFENETSAIQNLQKRELLFSKLESKIENTLLFNRLNKGLMSKEKKDDFLNEITKQATLSPKDWLYYTHEVDKLFEGKIVKLKEQYEELTDTDRVVIALICLKINIPDSCLLLDMSKNTLYNRRKTIKIRLNLDADTD
ncbi:MAG: hypothetical protein ACOYM7_10270, partial [Paludibacter sp.]